MPVMEGKCVLFKSFGGVDAFPLCVKTHDVDEFGDDFDVLLLLAHHLQGVGQACQGNDGGAVLVIVEDGDVTWRKRPAPWRTCWQVRTYSSAYPPPAP